MLPPQMLSVVRVLAQCEASDARRQKMIGTAALTTLPPQYVHRIMPKANPPPLYR
jgi:hypothetical protein